MVPDLGCPIDSREKAEYNAETMAFSVLTSMAKSGLLFCTMSALVLCTGCGSGKEVDGNERNDAAGESGKGSGAGHSDNETSDEGDSDGSEGESTDSNGEGSGGSEGSTNEQDGSEAAAGLSDYSAGSRLEARVLTGGDGSKQFYGWYDTKLEVPCSYKMLGQGAAPLKGGAKLHCLPAMLHVETTKYYDTNGCDEEPVAIGGPVGCDDATTYKYGLVPSVSTCGDAPEIKELKSVTPLKDDYVWYKNDRGNCWMLDTDAQNYVKVELGESVELSHFVAGSIEE